MIFHLRYATYHEINSLLTLNNSDTEQENKMEWTSNIQESYFE